MLLCDFHVHSTFSDGVLTIRELVDFYGTRGFDAIAVTDHICEESSFLGSAAHFLNRTLTATTFSKYMEELEEQSEYAWKKHQMILIPGFELTQNSLSNHRSAHVLGLGVSEYIAPTGDILPLIKAIKEQGALAIAAHPVDTRMREPQTYHLWNRREELRPHLDAWEVASGPLFFSEVEEARLPLIASSDFHKPRNINAWKTLVDAEKHPQAVLEAVKAQRVAFRLYKDAEIPFAQQSRLPLNFQKLWAMEQNLIPTRS